MVFRFLFVFVFQFRVFGGKIKQVNIIKNKKFLIILGILIFILLGIGGYFYFFRKDTVEEPIKEEPVVVEKEEEKITYAIVDTNQGKCYDNEKEVVCPEDGKDFLGQDAQHNGNQASYTDNNDGTITDNVTGLMWQKDPGEKKELF